MTCLTSRSADQGHQFHRTQSLVILCVNSHVVIRWDGYTVDMLTKY